jgi:hypothetical protein
MMRISVIVPEFCKTALINGTIGAIRGLKGGDTPEITVVDGQAG